MTRVPVPVICSVAVAASYQSCCITQGCAPASSSRRGENMVVFRSRCRSASLCACSGVAPAATADLMAGAYTCRTGVHAGVDRHHTSCTDCHVQKRQQSHACLTMVELPVQPMHQQ